jgi:hypothetical protein
MPPKGTQDPTECVSVAARTTCRPVPATNQEESGAAAIPRSMIATIR